MMYVVVGVIIIVKVVRCYILSEHIAVKALDIAVLRLKHNANRKNTDCHQIRNCQVFTRHPI